MLAFERADIIYRNSNQYKTTWRVIDGYSPVLQVSKLASIIFRSLDDELDDSADDLRISVWRLKSTIELSILPFDSPNLNLSQLLNEVALAGRFYPELKTHLDSLSEFVKWLTNNPQNPKQTEVITTINSINSDRKIGIASRLTRGRIPGWDDGGWSEFLSLLKNSANNLSKDSPACTKIISVSTLKNDLFDLILVPSGGSAVPFRRDLYTLFSAPEILMICYSNEKKYTYSLKKLPPGCLKFNFKPKHKENEFTDETSSESVHIDDWFDNNYWDLTRKKILIGHDDVDSTGNAQFTVRGRLALLGAKKGVYFCDDHKVIEISDLVEGRIGIDDFGNKYPRKAVQQLKRGNLVVLRTSGSGDALDDVSTSLMMNDNKFGLLDSSCAWKVLLQKALEQHGTDAVASMLARNGHQIRNPHYLWMWTTKMVIKPESKETFVDLIRIINNLGYDLSSDSPEKYAHEKWEEMHDLVRYRMKAGQKIRVALLDTLRNFIKKGVHIEDEHHLSLAGVGGGELTIFRITGIDSQSQNVPYSRTGIVTDLET